MEGGVGGEGPRVKVSEIIMGVRGRSEEKKLYS